MTLILNFWSMSKTLKINSDRFQNWPIKGDIAWWNRERTRLPNKRARTILRRVLWPSSVSVMKKGPTRWGTGVLIPGIVSVLRCAWWVMDYFQLHQLPIFLPHGEGEGWAESLRVAGNIVNSPPPPDTFDPWMTAENKSVEMGGAAMVWSPNGMEVEVSPSLCSRSQKWFWRGEGPPQGTFMHLKKPSLKNLAIMACFEDVK